MTTPRLVYRTAFNPQHAFYGDGSSCYNLTGRSVNPFTANDPCVKCVQNKSADPAMMTPTEADLVTVRFPASTGSAYTYWTRIGTDYSSCTSFPDDCSSAPNCSSTQACCPKIGGGVYEGYFEFWMYVPAEEPTRINLCDYNAQQVLPRTYPFYHGGKLLGVCSKNCPTGNKQTAEYTTGWTLRLMFREQGRLVLLYSVPPGGFPLDPVPPFFAAQPQPPSTSDSTDQYWFATTDTSMHSYRLAEYCFNPVKDLNYGQTQHEWGNNIPNPIDQILQYGAWNFLRVAFDVPSGTVKVFHGFSQSRDRIPDLRIVVNTPAGSIPFTTKDPMQSVYWQPFYGGQSCDWLPSCLSECPPDSQTACYKKTPSYDECSPYFIFGDLSVYAGKPVDSCLPLADCTCAPSSSALQQQKQSSPPPAAPPTNAHVIITVVVIMVSLLVIVALILGIMWLGDK